MGMDMDDDEADYCDECGEPITFTSITTQSLDNVVHIYHPVCYEVVETKRRNKERNK